MKIRMAWIAPSALLLQSACQMPETLNAGDSLVGIVTAPSPAPTDAVCNPLDTGEGGGGSDHGLLGKLWYVPAGGRAYHHVRDFEERGVLEPVTLFFNQLNVPTRPFDEGFRLSDGSLLKTPEGETLYEYFALHFDSVLRLSAAEQPGRYEFALLSDDGAVLKVKDGESFRTLVDNDGTHPSRLGCADEDDDRQGTVRMDASTRLPIQVDYYQGPRYHIALVLLWRRVPDHVAGSCGADHDEAGDHDDRRDHQDRDHGDDEDGRGDRNFGIGQDPACGRQGNSEFFDSTHTPSVPEPTWLKLLERGWSVVGPDNFLLPDGAPTNPCVTPSPSPSPSPTPSSSPTPSPSPTPSVPPSPTPSPSPSAAPLPDPSPTPSVSPTTAPSPTPTISLPLIS